MGTKLTETFQYHSTFDKKISTGKKGKIYFVNSKKMTNFAGAKISVYKNN